MDLIQNYSKTLDEKLQSLQLRERKTRKLILGSTAAFTLTVSFAIALLLFGFSDSREKLNARNQEVDRLKRENQGLLVQHGEIEQRLQRDLLRFQKENLNFNLQSEGVETLRNNRYSLEELFGLRDQHLEILTQSKTEYEAEITRLRLTLNQLQAASHVSETKLSTVTRENVDLSNKLNREIAARRDARLVLDEIISELSPPQKLPNLVDDQLVTFHTLFDESAKLDSMVIDQQQRASDLSQRLTFISKQFENPKTEPAKLRAEAQTSLTSALKLFESLKESRTISSEVHTRLLSARTDASLVNTVNDYSVELEKAQSRLKILRVRFQF